MGWDGMGWDGGTGQLDCLFCVWAASCLAGCHVCAFIHHSPCVRGKGRKGRLSETSCCLRSAENVRMNSTARLATSTGFPNAYSNCGGGEHGQPPIISKQWSNGWPLMAVKGVPLLGARRCTA